jgi:hypothetical protein
MPVPLLCSVGWKPLQAVGKAAASLGSLRSHHAAGVIRNARRVRRARRAASAAIGWKSALVCTALPIAALGVGGWAAGKTEPPIERRHQAGNAQTAIFLNIDSGQPPGAWPGLQWLDAAPLPRLDPLASGLERIDIAPLPPWDPSVPGWFDMMPPLDLPPGLERPGGQEPRNRDHARIPAGESPAVIPEPGSIALLSPALLVLAALRRRFDRMYRSARRGAAAPGAA